MQLVFGYAKIKKKRVRRKFSDHKSRYCAIDCRDWNKGEKFCAFWKKDYLCSIHQKKRQTLCSQHKKIPLRFYLTV